ncbi:MAG: hypothetical protein GQ557_01345 [Mycoplasmataceae bacterium]|nr:hypothetical protein [Mycoplasmataceae bacterium]
MPRYKLGSTVKLKPKQKKVSIKKTNKNKVKKLGFSTKLKSKIKIGGIPINKHTKIKLGEPGADFSGKNTVFQKFNITRPIKPTGSIKQIISKAAKAKKNTFEKSLKDLRSKEDDRLAKIESIKIKKERKKMKIDDDDIINSLQNIEKQAITRNLISDKFQ